MGAGAPRFRQPLMRAMEGHAKRGLASLFQTALVNGGDAGSRRSGPRTDGLGKLGNELRRLGWPNLRRACLLHRADRSFGYGCRRHRSLLESAHLHRPVARDEPGQHCGEEKQKFQTQVPSSAYFERFEAT